MNSFLNICFIFMLIYETKGQTAKCNYGVSRNEYSCVLDTTQANYNEKLTRIDGQHGAGKSDADVKKIENFKDNKLKTFSSIFCEKFPNLETIRIHEAELESIDEDSLLNCKNLEKLYLTENKIQELPEKLLIGNPKLTLLWAYDNQLTTLPENLFSNKNEIDDLIFNNNPINYLPSNIFRPLTKLKKLLFYNNTLESMNPEWFVNLQNLNWLGIYFNKITEIPSKCFAPLRNLEILFLDGNKIKTLNSDSFDGLKNLKLLRLGDNDISDLPIGVFTPLKSLTDLSLYNNKLTTIHSDSFDVNNKLTRIDFQDNKINAIDEKFIDNAAISTLSMENNICSQSFSKNKAEAKNNLRNCFANYQPRSVQIPTQSSCGRSLLPQGNIVGGSQIKPNSYPWIAALMRPSGQFFCGGTLVSNRKIVTAAHCIQQKREFAPLLPRSVIVLLGFHDFSNSIEIGRVPYAVQDIHIHPDWNPYTTSYDADIAVLTLYREVTFNEHIQPICMTSADPSLAASTEGVIVGNGKGGQDNEYETIPKILKMPIQTAQHCTDKDSTFRDLLTGRTFCAGSGKGQGVCTGDSGSGFIVKIGNIFYLRGIVSASLYNSILGCDVDSYSVFTDALKYINWINKLSTVPDLNARITFPI